MISKVGFGVVENQLLRSLGYISITSLGVPMALLLSVDYKLLKSLDYVVAWGMGSSENLKGLNQLVADSIARGQLLSDDQVQHYSDLREWADAKKLDHLKQVLVEHNPEGLKLVFDKPSGRLFTNEERKSFFIALQRGNFASLTQLFKERSRHLLEQLGKSVDNQGKNVMQLTEGKEAMRAFLMERGVLTSSS